MQRNSILSFLKIFFYFLAPVDTKVVCDKVRLFFRKIAFDGPHRVHEFLMPVPIVAFLDDIFLMNQECSDEGFGSILYVFIINSFKSSESHWLR